MKARFIQSNGVRITAIALSLILSACASKQEKLSCAQTDWYEVGRQDGAQGDPVGKLGERQNQCGGDFQADWQTIYKNGRNAGLVDYCSPDNGFELGRSGIAYYHVCPSTVESQFLEAYRRGLRVHKIEVDDKAIEAKINQVSQKLVKVGDDVERNRLSEELAQLQKVKSQNKRQLTEISN